MIGVVGGTTSAPRVTYLGNPIPTNAALLGLVAEPVTPEEVFRFAAPCAGSDCLHFSDGECSLGERLTQIPTQPDQDLPRCGIRPRCRWWRERGPAACARCPLVVSRDFAASDARRAAAAPPARVVEP